jgi:hypothetical protein
LTEREFTKILDWPGYRVYRHEIDEKTRTLKLWVRRAQSGILPSTKWTPALVTVPDHGAVANLRSVTIGSRRTACVVAASMAQLIRETELLMAEYNRAYTEPQA